MKFREPYVEVLYLVHLRACVFSACSSMSVGWVG